MSLVVSSLLTQVRGLLLICQIKANHVVTEKALALVSEDC